MKPSDRRGLGEIVAWCCSVVMGAVVLVVALIKNNPAVPYLAAPFIGAIVALISRGTKAAIDRDAQAEQREQQRREPDK